MIRTAGLIICVLLSLIVTGCNEDTPETLAAQQAIAIETGEECHLCGMIITNFPGPKGQLYERGQEQNKRFCSTRDMFAYLLDPEHQHNIQQAFVHNMAVSPWDHPDEETYIDARQAWYVVGSSLKGAMGPTLASFADQPSAQKFAELNGGKLYQFSDLNLELISSMGF
ncbi:nitrous oxide reductase accessory protein NosL [Motiliproteus sp. MSK22-1]|nr:nitrous oxide reductase accessory protein NosL [Motiliproteus sp. MSK22-1]